MIKIIVERNLPNFEIREGFTKKCEWEASWESSFDDILDMLMEAAHAEGFRYLNGDNFIKYGMELNEEEFAESRYNVFYADENVDNE